MQLDIWHAMCPEKGEQTKYQVAAKGWCDAAKHAYRFIYLIIWPVDRNIYIVLVYKESTA